MMLKQVISTVSPFLKQQGYSRTNKCFFKTENDIAYCIEFDQPIGIIYVTYYIIPLYIPCNNRYYTYGNRLHAYAQSKHSVISIPVDDNDVAGWCATFFNDFRKIILPFFSSWPFSHQSQNPIKNRIHDFQARIPCSNIDFCRLCFFAFAYSGQDERIKQIVPVYKQELHSCSYLSPTIIKDYLNEVESVLHSITCDKIGFFQKIKEHTLLVCFKKKLTNRDMA